MYVAFVSTLYDPTISNEYLIIGLPRTITMPASSAYEKFDSSTDPFCCSKEKNGIKSSRL